MTEKVQHLMYRVQGKSGASNSLLMSISVSVSNGLALSISVSAGVYLGAIGLAAAREADAAALPVLGALAVHVQLLWRPATSARTRAVVPTHMMDRSMITGRPRVRPRIMI